MTIDWWTLGIQTVNVVILVWLLQHFFWRPVAAMIEHRRAAIQKTLADATAAQDTATTAQADVARTRAGFDKEREAVLTEARSQADQARTAILDQAAKEVASREAAATASIARQGADAEASWSDHATELAIAIAGRLAARLQGPAVSAIFLDWLLSGIHALPEAARQAAVAEGASVETVSASPLAPDEQDRYRTLIAEAFGTHPTITFKADPALIAGLELHGAQFNVSNSWRADLGRILAEIKRDAG